MRARRWLLRALGGDLQVEVVDFPSGGGEAMRQSVREADALLWQGLTGRDPDARRVLEQVYDALHGGTATPRQGSWARGPSFESTLAQELRFAAYSGRLKVQRVERVRVVPPPTESAAEVLGPASSPATATTWFSLKVLDEIGDPVDGIDIAYTLGAQRRVVTTNGAGVARLEGIDAGSSTSARVASIADHAPLATALGAMLGRPPGTVSSYP